MKLLALPLFVENLDDLFLLLHFLWVLDKEHDVDADGEGNGLGGFWQGDESALFSGGVVLDQLVGGLLLSLDEVD